jgi:putative endonuclease
LGIASSAFGLVAMTGKDMSRQYYVYILTNRHNTVLYTGVTGDLRRRVYEHKEGLGGGFTSRYNVRSLVYFEVTRDVHAAIAREKQIKGGSRSKKIGLVEGMNPEWKDLYEGL